MELRLEAAGLALPYTVPRLIAMVQNNANPNETRLVITGGLPRLPGVNTIMPGDPPAPRQSIVSPKRIIRETEVGSCTVSEADQN
jgi:hypothetical protein